MKIGNDGDDDFFGVEPIPYKLGGDAPLYLYIGRRHLLELTCSFRIKPYGRDDPCNVSRFGCDEPWPAICCRGPSKTNCIEFSNGFVHLSLCGLPAFEMLKEAAAWVCIYASTDVVDKHCQGGEEIRAEEEWLAREAYNIVAGPPDLDFRCPPLAGKQILQIVEVYRIIMDSRG